MTIGDCAWLPLNVNGKTYKKSFCQIVNIIKHPYLNISIVRVKSSYNHNEIISCVPDELEMITNEGEAMKLVLEYLI